MEASTREDDGYYPLASDSRRECEWLGFRVVVSYRLSTLVVVGFEAISGVCQPNKSNLEHVFCLASRENTFWH